MHSRHARILHLAQTSVRLLLVSQICQVASANTKDAFTRRACCSTIRLYTSCAPYASCIDTTNVCGLLVRLHYHNVISPLKHDSGAHALLPVLTMSLLVLLMPMNVRAGAQAY